MKAISKIKRPNFSSIIFKAGLCLLLALTAVGCGDDDTAVVLTPTDIIIIVDNSSDMRDVIQGLQNNINAGLAQELDDAGLDYRIILIGRYGELNDESVCIEAPLSGIGDCSILPAQPVNSSRFFHYSTEIGSTDSWCKILETLNAADEFNSFPNGWIDLLRANSSTVFIEFSNDGVDCVSGVAFDDLNTGPGGTAAAAAFNTALTNAAPGHFGTAANPDYIFISMTANPDKDGGNPATPYTSSDPITTSECPTAVHPGTGCQGLSILTNGVRYSNCDQNDYDAIFNAVAGEILDAASN